MKKEERIEKIMEELEDLELDDFLDFMFKNKRTEPDFRDVEIHITGVGKDEVLNKIKGSDADVLCILAYTISTYIKREFKSKLARQNIGKLIADEILKELED